jgi:chromosome partitioning protein
VDLDPQVNASRRLGVVDVDSTLQGALLGKHPLKAHPTRTPNLVVVAGSEALSGLEQLTSGMSEREYLLRTLLTHWQKRCEFVVLDCPPSLDLLTVNAYACATEVYIPLEGQLYAADGVSKVLELVARIRQRLNPQLHVKEMFFTRFDKRKVLRRETAEELRSQYPDLVLTTVIRESIALGEAPHLGQDIFSYAPQSAGAEDYEPLVQEILAR